MNTAHVIARFFDQAELRPVFGYPGDPNVELLEALRQTEIEFVLTTREGTAGLMAEAYGMLTGKPGVCVSTLGPGSTNLVNAVANAYLDRAPMLALSGQIDGRRYPVFTHQVVDHNRLFSPISKWACEIQPHNAATVLRKAYRTALAARPGPVHITTPADAIAADASDDSIQLPPVTPARHGLQVIASESSADPIAAITAARRPLLLVGISAAQDASNNNTGAAIIELAERLSCPIVVAPMAKGVVPEDHPLFAGVLDMACNDVVWDFLRQADLLLNIGFDAVELIKPWTLQVRVIHIDTVANTDQIYPAELELIGPIAACLQELSRALPADLGERWARDEIQQHRDTLRQRYRAGRVAGKLNPSDVIDVARAASQQNAIATCDVGSHKLLVGQGWTTYQPRGVLMSNGLSSMGFSLPAAMVAKYLYPERDVVCFTGDGGLAMVQGELRLAASLRLGLKIIVFCDQSLNRIELKQQAKQYPSTGTRIAPTDLERLAQSMDCHGSVADSAQGLQRLLAEPAPADRPWLIGAVIDPSQYLAQF